MAVLPVKVFVEYPQEKPFVETLLRPYAVEVYVGLTSSAAVSAARTSLMLEPGRPVAVVFNADAENARPEDTRLTVKRILARAYPENWYVAVAIPNLVAWAMTDPRIKRELDLLDGKAYYIDRAARASELATTLPFDPTELLKLDTDYPGLLEFVQKHIRAAQVTAKTTSP